MLALELQCVFSSFQLVMQYLYCGGAEALHIRNTDIMEVRVIKTAFTADLLTVLCTVMLTLKNYNTIKNLKVT